MEIRKESETIARTIPEEPEPADVANPNETKEVVSVAPKKERKISRFKVSVVTEPDPSKLQLPEKKEEKVQADVKEGNKQEKDVCTIINDTYESLVDVLSAYPQKKGTPATII